MAFVHLSPPDDQGYCTYGVESGLTKGPAESANIDHRRNKRTNAHDVGDTQVHISKLDAIVPVRLPVGRNPHA